MAKDLQLPAEGEDPVLDALYIFCQKKCNTEIVLDIDATGVMYLAVRIRPYTGSLKGKMICVEGETVQQGVINALQAARAGKWRDVDFAYRPWQGRPAATDTDWR